MRSARPLSQKLSSAPSLSVLLESNAWKQLVRELHLTQRQADVVRLVLCAKRDKEIAAALGVGIPTVRMHLRYAFAVLGVSDRMELATLLIPLLCQRVEAATNTIHRKRCSPRGEAR